MSASGEGPAPFSLDVDDRDPVSVMTVRGELDLVTAPEVETAVTERLKAGRHVVLDLRELDFLDSSGIRALVEGRAIAEEQGSPARFSVVRPDRQSVVWNVLEVSGLDAALEFLDAPPA